MRPLRITEEMHAELLAEFSKHLKSVVMTDGGFSFTKKFTDVKNKNKVFVTFSMKAYIKMRDLVDRYQSEIGWYGFVDKISDFEYHVDDICVYSQLVTGATVKEGNECIDDKLSVAQIKRKHFHCHSHVNMGCSPSSTDMNQRKEIMANVSADSFYIFMITNKRCEWTAVVYDLAGNTMYNTDDILIDVDLGDGEMLSDFVDETKKMVKTSTPTLLKNMMDERNGIKPDTANPIMTTSNAYRGRDPWMPKSAVSTQAASDTKRNKKKVSGKKTVEHQYSLLDDEIDKQLEDYASYCEDYYDEILGHVSDSPIACSKEILSMMR